MEASEIPSELTKLYKKLTRRGLSDEEVLSAVLTQYDAMYTEKMQAFWQAWDNGWTYGLDEMPTSPCAAVPVYCKEPERIGRPKARRRIRVTSIADPNYEKVYESMEEAAEGEGVNKSTIYAKLRGERQHYSRIYTLRFEDLEEERWRIPNSSKTSGKSIIEKTELA